MDKNPKQKQEKEPKRTPKKRYACSNCGEKVLLVAKFEADGGLVFNLCSDCLEDSE